MSRCAGYKSYRQSNYSVQHYTWRNNTNMNRWNNGLFCDIKQPERNINSGEKDGQALTPVNWTLPKKTHSKSNYYPIMVEWPMETDGPIIAPDPMRTSGPITEFEWTTAPISIFTLVSITADLWKIPPPLCHLLNSWQEFGSSKKSTEWNDTKVNVN